jgi:hypothetical protein
MLNRIGPGNPWLRSEVKLLAAAHEGEAGFASDCSNRRHNQTACFFKHDMVLQSLVHQTQDN